jgi:hypothetical protein
MANASGKPSTVWLKGEGLVKERNAGGAITPGHCVVLGSGNTVTVQGAAAEGPMLVALEQDTLGKDIDTAYASGDRVPYAAAGPGDEFYCLVPAAASAIVVGDFLQFGAGGTLIKRTTTNPIRAIALEAVDNSAGGTAVRIRAEAV